ncbi:D-alanyl-D-alanine carboxypeptidase family protein [Bacillota bacterium LX-D]|nr:D-alanyl-D-alanine carboxypeptidase family protein [Bacillota bacterium LX-D]
MKSNQRMLALVLTIFLLMSLIMPIIPAYAEAEPQIIGESAVLIEMNSGQVLWSKNDQIARPPASTTKIMTALIALEKGKLTDKVVISKAATEVEGTRVYLKVGEKQTLENLLYAMLLNSANDAAYAIAEHIGGNVNNFAKLMNAEAKKIGAVHTHFVTPNGLPADGHYTTAYDLALIARTAMQNEKFREIVATKTRPWHGAAWESTLHNQNNLLFNYSGTIGVKTGYTSEAKMCLVTAAQRNGDTYLAVVLGSSGKNIWTDSEKLLDYAFKNYYTQALAVKGETVAEVKVGKNDLQVTPISDLVYLQSRITPVHPQSKIKILPVKKSVEKGEKVGEIQYLWKGQEIGKVELVAKNSVQKDITLLDGWLYLTSAVTICLFSGILLKFAKGRKSRGFRRARYGYKLYN